MLIYVNISIISSSECSTKRSVEEKWEQIVRCLELI